MTPRIIEAIYVKDFTINFRFSDSSEGEIDFENDLDGEIFKPLRDVSYFKKFLLDKELHTVVWPNGADFAPEYLYDKLKVLA